MTETPPPKRSRWYQSFAGALALFFLIGPVAFLPPIWKSDRLTTTTKWALSAVILIGTIWLLIWTTAKAMDIFHSTMSQYQNLY